MPFETRFPPSRIAVIGGGISGLAAAHLLASDHAVVLFEAADRLGGHAHTVWAGKRGDQPVDMGFIVFNRVNYPLLSGLFDRLGVPVAPSNMSFGASIQGGEIEYGLKSLSSLFAQRKNAFSPSYLRMLADILKFHRKADQVLRPGMTLRDLLAALGTSDAFRDHYITPFTGAIWSTPTEGVLDFPAEALIRFFVNHGLMGVFRHHQWETVKGGSIEYVRRVEADLTRQGVEIRLKAPVAAVRRLAEGVLVRAEGGEWEAFDEVIFASHSDQTLAMLADATPSETKALKAIRYQPNTAILHCDESLMPRSRRAWASWTYAEPKGPRAPRIDLTYWMNSLQPIPKEDPLFVSLNPNRAIDPAKIYETRTFHHPVYDLAALKAQEEIRAFNGTASTWFCGAWMKNGFHEDGFASAHDVALAIRARRPALVEAAQ
ncbi:NAD(P)/FAD-dependent oxidoreductase [Stagnihabitans tardus]|uniref:NAD(P)-binding protein n=1 Tax=Stagnihabitans tardus TaxID=2699202 RepID=A0AAE4YCQ9_9RHOB|nr:FAD-dependent oxidoreductase [Stagnihabitans tardus]NBZ87565.1 NAD(P)-binding protein [Stagnihabitans tardus]